MQWSLTIIAYRTQVCCINPSTFHVWCTEYYVEKLKLGITVPVSGWIHLTLTPVHSFNRFTQWFLGVSVITWWSISLHIYALGYLQPTLQKNPVKVSVCFKWPGFLRPYLFVYTAEGKRVYTSAKLPHFKAWWKACPHRDRGEGVNWAGSTEQAVSSPPAAPLCFLSVSSF